VIVGLIGLFASFLFLSQFLSNYTNNLLKDKLSKNPNLLYHITYDNMELNILKGEITLSKIKMVIDTNYADSLKKLNNYPHTLYSGAVSSLKLTGINAFDIYWNKVIQVNTLLIHQPEVELLLTHSEDTIMPNNFMAGEGIKEILEYLNHSKINSVSLVNGRLKVNSEIGKEIRAIGQADSFNLKVLNFEIDSTNNQQPYLVEEVNISFKNAEFDLSQDYFMKLGKFQLSLSDSNLIAKDFKLIPKKSIEQFSKNKTFRKTRVNIVIPHLMGTKIDFNSIIFSGVINIGLVEITDGNFDFFKDMTKDWRGKKTFSTPHEMLKMIPFPLHIAQVQFENTKILNQQLVEIKKPLAELFIENGNFNLANITNDSTQLGKNNLMELVLDIRIMNTTTLKGFGVFNLSNTNQNFELEFNISKTKLEPFNPLLKSFMHLEVTSGELNSGKIVLQGSKYKIKGTCELEYSNASLSFEQKKKGLFSKLKTGVLNGIANTTIRNNNEKTDPKFKIGEIDYNYDKKLPFIRNVWLSTQLGIVDVIIPFSPKASKR